MPNLVQMIPMKVFKNNNLNPVSGAVFNFDVRIAKILTVSGGRVMVDFNNPLAGKDVVYEINILRKVNDLNEKIKAFINFLFRKDLDFSVKDTKIILEVEKGMTQFVEMFKDKFKEYSPNVLFKRVSNSYKQLKRDYRDLKKKEKLKNDFYRLSKVLAALEKDYEKKNIKQI